jgi:hypothetical protein
MSAVGEAVSVASRAENWTTRSEAKNEIQRTIRSPIELGRHPWQKKQWQ